MDKLGVSILEFVLNIVRNFSNFLKSEEGFLFLKYFLNVIIIEKYVLVLSGIGLEEFGDEGFRRFVLVVLI